IISAVSFVWIQALKEGYELMLKSPFEIDLKDLAEINRIWKNGAVIRSYLVELCGRYFREGKALPEVIEAVRKDLKIDINTLKYIQKISAELNLPTPALSAALSAGKD
ncbi:MAG: hypothetical protein NC898_06770, partial [Candidatus Omnitrophica bacterium]|nr:hypothetical protein [Candidatus Omnitrophota bacterium]